jgi:hypothetical protein
MAQPTIEPITDALLPDFCRFLQANMPVPRSAEDWERSLRLQWMPGRPNFGFALRNDAGVIVGGIGAYYADRIIRGQAEKFCNITSWCVLDAYLQQSMRLAMAVIGQTGYHFTDFSPTKVVGNTLKFFKFKELDERQAVILNWPSPSFGSARVRHEPSDIEAALTGTDLQIYRDHRGFPLLKHVVLGSPDAPCHVIYRSGHLKGLATANILFVADRDRFIRHFRQFSTFLFLRGVWLTVAEMRVLPRVPWPAKVRGGFNRKVYLSSTLGEQDIDYLYSEQVALDLRD